MHTRLQASARSNGFTLVELLTVIVIISIMSALAFAAFVSIKGANDLSTSTSTIGAVLEQARTYAMANNTYVFVGLEETNMSTPSTQTQTAGTGRIGIQAFASLDGTSSNLAAQNLVAITKLQILNNVHMPSSLSNTTGSLPQRGTLGVSNVASSFPSPYSNIASANGYFTFSQIISFNAQGIASIPSGTAPTNLEYVEIDLEPTHGTTIPATENNVSAIQVDATTGAVSIYRS